MTLVYLVKSEAETEVTHVLVDLVQLTYILWFCLTKDHIYKNLEGWTTGVTSI